MIAETNTTAEPNDCKYKCEKTELCNYMMHTKKPPTCKLLFSVQEKILEDQRADLVFGPKACFRNKQFYLKFSLVYYSYYKANCSLKVHS